MRAATQRGALARWATDLALGVRMSVAGGRSGWSRLVLISIGVGLGVAMLLIAATLPNLAVARDARLDARSVDKSQSLPQGDDTLLLTDINSEYQDRDVNGWLVQPDGPRAPLPPGVARLPGPGELVVSPAMERLLASEEGALLRHRWGDQIIGTIGATGLAGPKEHAFYLGTDRLTEETATRIRSFSATQTPGDGGVSPILVLLGVVGLVVLLVPVAVFLATAVRFGGEARDRRLAALRLIGADAAATRRIAAGETLACALPGLVVGAVLFAAAGLLVNRFVPAGMSFYLADFRPVPVLAALVAVLVPVVVVLVTLSALRGVALEPLGVVRLGHVRRRRLWWRLILPVAGLVLLYPLHDGLAAMGPGFEYRVLAGVAALLIGVALLLPWLVQAAVHRLGGGGVAWQLAVRRLQLDSGTAVRAVSGIAVSVAGVLAVQGLFSAVQGQFSAESGRGADRFQAQVLPWLAEPDERWTAALADVPGVRAVETVALVQATPTGAPEGYAGLHVGDCDGLRALAEIGGCTGGDTFVVDNGRPLPRPGTTYTLGEPTGTEAGPAPRWTLPGNAQAVQASDPNSPLTGTTILVTPAALQGSRPDLSQFSLYVALDPSAPAAFDRVRNAAAHVDPSAYVTPVRIGTVETVLANVRQGLLIGATALLVLIGASMLVNVVEQLRERRRLLAVLIAFGTRPATLARSVLYQVAVPVLIGMTLAVATGTGLAAVLQAAAGAPIRLDWAGIGATSGVAAMVVLLTTMASLPLVGRLTRPGGLRSE